MAAIQVAPNELRIPESYKRKFPSASFSVKVSDVQTPLSLASYFAENS